MDQNTSDHTAFLESKEEHYAAKRITLVGIGHELEEKKRKKKKKEGNSRARWGNSEGVSLLSSAFLFLS